MSDAFTKENICGVARYAQAAAMVALAVLTRFWLVGSFGPMPMFITFYPAVLLAASIGGGGPGMVAAVLSSLASTYFFIEPVGSLYVRATNDAIALGIFGSMSLFLCAVMERLRRARWHKAVSDARERELALLDMGNLVALDRERRIARWSTGCARLYGYDAPEAEGRQVDELLRTRFPQPAELILQELAARDYWEGEVFRSAKDGSELVVAILMAARRGGDARSEAVLEVSTNVTRQKLSERLLSESEEKFRNLFHNAGIAMFRSKLDGSEILDANSKFLELVGMTREEAIGASSSTLWADRSQRAEMVRRLSAQGRVSDYEYKLLDRRGAVKDCMTSLVLYREQGVLEGSILDLSEIKRAETERLRFEQQLLHAQKLESLGVLAGGIAHDFNNILTSIVGNADLAMMKINPESPAVDHLRRVEQAAARAADLARQMLAYSGKGRFTVVNLDLDRLLEEMLHMLEVSISKKAVLRLDLTPNLPSVEADATQLRQVVMNLVINASEAVGDKSGVIAITTGCMDCDRDYLRDVWLSERITAGPYVYLEVADTGCGMDRETMSKIFDPFFTTKFTGRGLGMAAVLGIVRGHKGAIRVYSEPGKGTTFKVLLPASNGPAEIFNHAVRDDRWQGEGTVLLVDDEETVRGIGREMLAELGFATVTANDGKQALEAFKRNPDCKLVILDLTMPHMDGEQCFRELRRLKPEVKVLMSSGYNEQDVTQKFVGKGLAGFIQKPYKLSALKEAIQKIL